MTYKVGMFENSSKRLLASGKFVHVYVCGEGRPTSMPAEIRTRLESIPVQSGEH